MGESGNQDDVLKNVSQVKLIKDGRGSGVESPTTKRGEEHK